MAQRSYDSIRDDYKTTAAIYKPILNFLNLNEFDLDVCCSDQNVPAKVYIMKDKAFNSVTGNYLEDCGNGLKIKWWGKCFKNCPFPECRQWMKKAVHEVETNNCEVWAVLPADRFETKYYQEYILHNKYCCFGFLNGKQGFIIPGKENIPPVPSQKIVIACFSKRAAEIKYSWNREKLFNTRAFLGGVDG